jgi:hypothetical protein
VLSQLLHSRVMFTVICSLHFNNTIVSSLTNVQSYGVQITRGVLLAQACL